MLLLLKLLRIERSFINICLDRKLLQAIGETLLIFVIGPLAQPTQIYVENTRIPNVEEMLKRYGVGLSKDALIAALANPKAEIRRLAAYKLAIDKDKDAIPFIQNALSVENNGTNRVHMALDLAELGDEKGIELLKNTCSDQKVPGHLRVLAAQDMLQIGNEGCLSDVLSIAQSDTGAQNRQVALSLLPQYFNDAKRAPAEVLNIISDRLADDSPLVRLEAAVVLSKVGSSEQAAALEEAIQKEQDPAIRARMEDELNKFKSKPAK